MKKYQKIPRADIKSAREMLGNMTEMTVLEKIDGANASFKLENGELKCFSRNNELDEHNTLRGFYNWVHENVDKDQLYDGDVFYGEWLVHHKVKYNEEAYGNFYLFDILDVGKGFFLHHKKLKERAYDLDLKTAHEFYHGEPLSLKELDNFVGKSALGAEEGEGIVIKSHMHDFKYKEQPRVKLISTKFKEVNKNRDKSDKSKDQLTKWLDNVLTDNRVEKMIHKLRNEDLIPNELSISDTGMVLKATGNKMVEDILEEELESLLKVVRQKISKTYPAKVREFIEKENQTEEKENE